jgi:hypothetical protein
MSVYISLSDCLSQCSSESLWFPSALLELDIESSQEPVPSFSQQGLVKKWLGPLPHITDIFARRYMDPGCLIEKPDGEVICQSHGGVFLGSGPTTTRCCDNQLVFSW